MRTRYWGLYDYSDGSWLGAELTGNKLWCTKPTKRKRFDSFEHAKRNAESVDGQCVPRPFYVTTKPRKLPPEAQAVIDAIKRYDACGVGWKAVIDALRAYEQTC